MATALQAKVRTDLKRSATKEFRQNGQVPGVIYGKKLDSKPIAVDSVDFIKLIRDNGRNGIISLGVDNNNHQVMVSDIQTDPLKGEVVHVDFFEVDMKSEIDADVRVTLEGEAPGEKDGGIVSHLLYNVTVRCLPNEIPEEIKVDISHLSIGDSIQISDIVQSVNVDIVNEPEETIVTVQAAAAEEEPGQGQEHAEEVEQAAEEQTETENSEEQQ
ncbi:50S ribosomal protein L25/general stress protein Ctc [Alkalihalobacterium bogoriense]|uniref:50S ribosomal protein L25/general stress protein Ctc n=1 Tax=Alkalihalobacterium bogoriense TaxID=246272 RepID=UPI000479BDF7|nr:50S ribosomal protein L25/general stress protein Ctc [Alkalihalobacterium bogoriense]